MTDVSETLATSIRTMALIAVMMKIVSTSETSVSFYKPQGTTSQKTVVFIILAART
jgi:uncharacterized membrane protein